MKKTDTLFILVVCLCLPFRSYSQESTLLKHRNNLDFHFDPVEKRIPGWQSALGDMPIKIDTVQKINGKASLNFPRIFAGDKPIHVLKGSFQQLIVLPEVQATTAEVSLTAKTQRLKTARLIVSGVTGAENILYSDTLSMPGDSNWNTCSEDVSLKDIAFLHLDIQMEGLDTVCEQNLWLDQITVKINGKKMDDYPVPTLPSVNVLRTEKLIPLSFSAPALYGDIPELRTKRIIALGETLHGSSTLNRSAFQLIEHQVKNNNCRLVLLELPSEQMLSFNRFIQGDETFCLDSLLTDIKHSLLSREQMSDLMLRLQKHNAGTKDKVWLLGMDYDNYTANSAMFLFDYLCTLNQTLYCSAIDSLCAILLKEEPFAEAADWLTGPQKEAFKKKIPKKEYDILLHCINTSLKRRGTEPPEFRRDEAMYENIKFFIDVICSEKERAIIYAHLKHTNPHNHLGTSIFPSSFGSWVKEEYPDDYFNIAMLVGSGTFTTYDWRFFKITMSLEKPYANTLEHALKETQTKYFYMPVSEIPARPVYLREISNAGLKDQYCIIYPHNRMDAVIYIDQSAPLDATSIVPGEITHPYLIAEQRYKRNLVKFNHRNKIKKEEE